MPSRPGEPEIDNVESYFPLLYRSADSASTQAQNRFLAATQVRLFAAIAAATFGAFSIVAGDIRVSAAVIVLALTVALVAELWLLGDRSEEGWYDGRALAESSKTLSWRFAVGGVPFETTLEETGALRRYSEQLRQLLADAPATSIAVSLDVGPANQLMAFRTLPFDTRRTAYLDQRVRDQKNWYAQKSSWNKKQALRWRLSMMTLEVVGIVAGLLNLVKIVDVDIAGVVAALIGASAAWLAVKQHEGLSRAYAYAANELALIETRLSHLTDEAEWAREVGDAEEAISREHTMWRASRSGR